jgi:hypothetical protein
LYRFPTLLVQLIGVLVDDLVGQVVRLVDVVELELAATLHMEIEVAAHAGRAQGQEAGA